MSYTISFSADFRRNTYGGLFIVLEGLDGSGKTAQIAPLKKYFEQQGKKVVLARAPRKDEGVLAAVNKQILQQKLKVPGVAFQYLFTADYIMQMEDVIIPALKRGDIVLSDRFVGWSAVPYGGFDQGTRFSPDIAWGILAAHGSLTKLYQLVFPDITFFLDVPLKTALTRVGKKHDAKEVYESEKVLKNIKKGYDWLLKEFPKEFTVIDAEKTLEEVTEDMISSLNEFSNKRINKSKRK